MRHGLTTRHWTRAVAVAVLALLVALVCGASAAGAEVRNPKGVAVIVGNAKYRNERVPEVTYAHRDAAAFRHYVVAVLGYDPENVIELRDADQGTLESVFGNERSHEGRLWRYLDPEGGSDVVVFYSGHGVPGLKDKRSYLLPVNADPDSAEINGYPLDVLYRNLSKLKEAESVRVFVDACFSGDSDQGMLVRSASPVYSEAELPKATTKLTVVTAASGQQLASWDEQARHGLFTHHLLDALHGEGDADGDGQVTAAEVKRYLDRHMTRAARRTYGRHQRATLAGDEAIVLASAVGGSFAARLVLKQEAGASSGKPEMGHAREAKTEITAAAVENALALDPEARMAIQRGLGSLKFDAGPVDGMFGNRTRGAIKGWQQAKGFRATGYLTRDQAEALRALVRVKAKSVSTLTISTVPADAKVRVFTTAGSAYRDGMQLVPGQYEVAVEAQNHAPFRQRLGVEGSTSYRIKLCRREQRPQQICEDKEVERFRTQQETALDSFSRQEQEMVFDYLDRKGKTWNWYDSRARSYENRKRMQNILCMDAEEKLAKRIDLRTKIRVCRENGGAYYRRGDTEPVCSCKGLEDALGWCKVRVSWQCKVTSEIRVPYMATEKVCRDVMQPQAVCPEETVTKLP